MNLDARAKNRFWDKVAPADSNGCRLWTASKRGKGYGYFSLDGESRYSHRVAYELVVGPIPAGIHVLHKCDNPPCVNVHHLFLGTAADNAADRDVKGRQARGENNGRAKLTESEVLDIVAAVRSGEMQKTVAKTYGIAPSTVFKIMAGRKWGWLTSH